MPSAAAVGQLAASPRCPQWSGRVPVAQAFAIAVAKEASQAGQTTGNCGSGIATFMQIGDVTAQLRHAVLLNFGRNRRLALAKLVHLVHGALLRRRILLILCACGETSQVKM